RLFGLAPTGGCRAAPVTGTRGGLLPHRCTLTCLAAGGLFSVALSVASRRPGVTWQSALGARTFLESRRTRDHRTPPRQYSGASAGPPADAAPGSGRCRRDDGVTRARSFGDDARKTPGRARLRQGRDGRPAGRTQSARDGGPRLLRGPARGLH